jgi:hypothetical protein
MISENRQAIRVNDQIVTSWRPANNAQLVGDNVHEIMTLSVNRELNNLIANLPEQASALRKIALLLNHKIDLTADKHNTGRYGPSLTRVNISTTGLAFDWHTTIGAGDQIRLTITLPPANERLTLTANVLDCSKVSDKSPYRVRCRFVAGQEQKLAGVEQYIDYTQSRIQAESSASNTDGDHTARLGREAPASLLHYR